jgi:hypothetical protein
MAWTRTLVALGLVLLAGEAHAQIARVPIAFEPPDPPEKSVASAPVAEQALSDGEEMSKQVHAFFSVNTTFGTTAGISGGGEVAVSRVRPSLTVLVPIDERSRMTFGLEYEYSHYAFEGAPTIIAGTRKPWGDVHRETISANYFRAIDEKWNVYGGGMIVAAHEEGADFGDSIEGGGYVGVSYAISKNFRIGPGFGIFTQLGDDPLYVPIVSVDWTIAKGWSLTNDRRLGLFLAWEPNDALTLKFGGEWQIRDFRLSRSGALPGGAVREQRVPISLEVEYDATRQIGLSAKVGVDAATHYRTFDRDGNGVYETNGKVAGFLSLGLVLRF